MVSRYHPGANPNQAGATLGTVDGRFVPRSAFGRRLAEHREQVLALAARRHGSKLRVFGSLARGEYQPDSDVDSSSTPMSPPPHSTRWSWPATSKTRSPCKSPSARPHRFERSCETRYWPRPSRCDRRDTTWLADILAAIDAIDSYLAEGDLSQGVGCDASRARLEIGDFVTIPFDQDRRWVLVHLPIHPRCHHWAPPCRSPLAHVGSMRPDARAAFGSIRAAMT